MTDRRQTQVDRPEDTEARQRRRTKAGTGELDVSDPEFEMLDAEDELEYLSEVDRGERAEGADESNR